MWFHKRGSLKKEYDEKLMAQLEQLKNQWQTEQYLWKKSFDATEDLKMRVKLAEIKYFYLFKEAKVRNIKITFNRKK